jgi:uncharacterized protein YceK
MKRRAIALVVCALLAGCSSSPSRDNSPPPKRPKPSSNQNLDYSTP